MKKKNTKHVSVIARQYGVGSAGEGKDRQQP